MSSKIIHNILRMLEFAVPGALVILMMGLIGCASTTTETFSSPTAGSTPIVIPSTSPAPGEATTPTAIAPPTNTVTIATPTEALSAEELFEQKFGPLQSCLAEETERTFISAGDETLDGTVYTKLKVHATDPKNAFWTTVPDFSTGGQKQREVLVLPVICKIGEGKSFTSLVVMGGSDFGVDGQDINRIYLYKEEVQPDGTTISEQGIDFGPVEELVKRHIREGEVITLFLPVTPGTGQFKEKSIPEWGTTNQDSILAVSTSMNDTAYNQALNNLVQSETPLLNNTILIPSRIEVEPPS